MTHCVIWGRFWGRKCAIASLVLPLGENRRGAIWLFAKLLWFLFCYFVEIFLVSSDTFAFINDNVATLVCNLAVKCKKDEEREI